MEVVEKQESLYGVIREMDDGGEVRDVAKSVVDSCGYSFFETYIVSMVTHQVRCVRAGVRNRSLREGGYVTRTSEAAQMRGSVSDIWDVMWTEVGKSTSQLTIDDMLHIIAQREASIVSHESVVTLMEDWIKKAKKHKAETLGELRGKIEL